MDEQLARIDATAQAELVRSGEASPLELVEAAIGRAERVNPQLNAIIHELYDEGRAEAAGELPSGPFSGVPFLFKDLGAGLAGQPLHMGMRALKEIGFRAPVDWYLGTRFRDAGFVTIGKTNVPELGMKPTTEPLAYGPTRNPWDVALSAGGSSGGAAAAVAAGIVPVAHASDGGGSIRIPASHCGLVGLKPTRARTSQGPVVGDFASGLNEELVLARSVRDVAAVLDAVHGPAPGDPYHAPAPRRPYLDELDAAPTQLRVRLLTHTAAGLEPDEECLSAARGAAELLESLGHRVDEGPLPGLDGADLSGSFAIRFAGGHALVVDQLSALLGRRLGPDDLEPMTWAVIEGARQCAAPDYVAAVALHQGLARALAVLMEAECDLLLSPTVGEPPLPIGTLDDDPDDPLAAFGRAEPSAMYTAPFNCTGQPAISLPLHRTERGVPIGVQLVAPFGREDLLIGVAAQLEGAQPWADAIPTLLAA